MPIPRLPATHHRKRAMKKAFQVNMKSAATAPMWNATMKKVVSLPTGSRNVLSRLKKFTSVCLLGGSCLPVSFDSSLPARNRADCNTCVIVGPEGQAPKELGIGLKFSNLANAVCGTPRSNARCAEYSFG